MKILVMCEGSNELELFKIMLENRLLKFDEDDLLGLRPYHARQIDRSTQVRNELNLYPGNDVLVVRVGDTLRDSLRIPKDYRPKIQKVEKYCTKPELEMLLILSFGLFGEFEKTKSSLRPKDFAKGHIEFNGRKYDNGSSFYRDYYGSNPLKLAKDILEYRRLKGGHARDELYLADLLREEFCR